MSTNWRDALTVKGGAPQEAIIKGMAEDVASVRAAILAVLHGGGDSEANP